MIYRYEIDGIRCIAIIFVFIYHYNSYILSGGFIGVDIFFCISGYVIAFKYKAVMFKKYQLLSFFNRRLIRLFPQSFLVLYYMEYYIYWFLDNNPKDILLDIRYSIFCISNIHFYKKNINYLYASQIVSPLLHFWSLSIETQFYIIYPLLNYLFNYIYILGFIPSLVFCIYTSFVYKSYSYFSFLSRLWEFLYGFFIPTKCRFMFLIPFGYIGLILLTEFAFLFNNKMYYPSFYALLPIICITPVLMHTGNNSFSVNTILTNILLTTIGKFSYTIYLWHFIIIRLYREKGIYTVIIVLTLFCLVSYNFDKVVEKLSKEHIFIISIVILLFGSIILYYTFIKIEFELQTIPSLYSDYGNIMKKCVKMSCNNSTLMNRKISTLLLLGDSHLICFIPIFKIITLYYNYNILFCWITKVILLSKGYNEIIKHHLKEIKKYKISNIYLCNRIQNNSSMIQNYIIAQIKLLLIITENIYFIEDVPKLNFNPHKCIIYNKNNCICQINKNCTYLAFNIIKAQSYIHFISVIDDLCINNICRLLYHKILMYVDFDHLSLEYVESLSIRLLHSFNFNINNLSDKTKNHFCIKYVKNSRRC